MAVSWSDTERENSDSADSEFRDLCRFLFLEFVFCWADSVLSDGFWPGQNDRDYCWVQKASEVGMEV